MLIVSRLLSPFAGVRSLKVLATRARSSLVGWWTDSYRPELHYMRGPGPRWRAAHPDTDGQGKAG